MEYDMKIDMWSLGCILAELYVGAPLFPGESELEQMRYMVSTLGVPPKGMRDRGRRSEQFFEPDGGFCEVVK
jgi:serine/threonine protein kinase